MTTIMNHFTTMNQNHRQHTSSPYGEKWGRLPLTLLLSLLTLLLPPLARSATAHPSTPSTGGNRIEASTNRGETAKDSWASLYILGGELSNSAATSVADIEEVLPRMAQLGLNTVLVPAQWDLIEPEEGHFDFTTIDAAIRSARQNGLKLVFLWFGAWKNSMSCYAPMWFKRDVKRFPRAHNAEGKPIEIASAFSENVFQADCRAWTALVGHIKEMDATEHTVIMLQVENEIGMLESARDHSPEADRAFARDDWRKVMSKARRLPKDANEDEVFMAYHYARYVERLAQASKPIYDLPLYVNAAMNSRGRKPGEYPSAGPLAHLADIWKAAAPSIGLLAPDIYDTGFKAWAAQYDMPDNRLFIPESRCCQNSGVRALYAFGRHEALGFSPFAIDQSGPADTREVSQAYGLLRQLQPLLMKERGRGTVHGVLFDQDDREQTLRDGDLNLVCRHNLTLPWDPRATDGSTWREGGAIIIHLAKDEYLVAGSGVVVEFKTDDELAQQQAKKLGEDGFAEAGTGDKVQPTASRWSGKRKGIGTVDEVSISADGTLSYLRRLNGDQTHQGRHVRIGMDDYQILHVRLYNY